MQRSLFNCSVGAVLYRRHFQWKEGWSIEGYRSSIQKKL